MQLAADALLAKFPINSQFYDGERPPLAFSGDVVLDLVEQSLPPSRRRSELVAECEADWLCVQPGNDEPEGRLNDPRRPAIAELGHIVRPFIVRSLCVSTCINGLDTAELGKGGSLAMHRENDVAKDRAARAQHHAAARRRCAAAAKSLAGA